MNNSNTHNQRIAKMTFASVYPMYLEKIEKKGRTKQELHQVIAWLTGFDKKKLQELIKGNATFEVFFQHASLNPNAHLITGVNGTEHSADVAKVGPVFVKCVAGLAGKCLSGRSQSMSPLWRSSRLSIQAVSYSVDHSRPG